MRFSEVAKRLTGFSTPIFGVSWQPPEAEVAVARRVVNFLEDRRVLFNPYELEVAEHCVDSVVEIRRFLTAELGGLGDDDDIAPHLVAMRAACRKFLDAFHDDGRWLHLPRGQYALSSRLVFDSAMGELRGVVGVHVAQLAAKYGLDVEDGLAAGLPAETDSADDGRPGD